MHAAGFIILGVVSSSISSPTKMSIEEDDHSTLETKASKFQSMATNASSPRGRPQYYPHHIPDPSYVRILDTTLRDGEQSPGAAMTSQEKLRIARQLARLGVDVIQPGFPSASDDDFLAVKMIAQEVGNTAAHDGHIPVIAGFCRWHYY